MLFRSKTSEDRYTLNPRFSNQKEIENYFKDQTDQKSEILKTGLLKLTTEVLFLEDPYKKGKYHPRITAYKTYSYRALDDYQRAAFNRLYDDFFYHRHNYFWQSQAMKKLPALISSTDMLVCGEDLGMIPACVPYVMDKLQILSLEIERMPKIYGYEFGDTATYPYLSVCTTSTHDMNPIRAWWEENKSVAQDYYNKVLKQEGKAPQVCGSDICQKIINNHLNSPSMFCILPLQDWLSVDENLRNPDSQSERINVPAVSRHYWRYRMHLDLDELLKAEEYNKNLKEMVKNSGR